MPTVIEKKPEIKFDPESSGYDEEAIQKYGLKPDETGHYQSRVPNSTPPGLILKGRKHKTYHLTEKGEEEAGYDIYKGADGRYYSRKKTISQTPLGLEQRIDERFGIHRDRVDLENAINQRLGITEEPVGIDAEAEQTKINETIDIADKNELPFSVANQYYPLLTETPYDPAEAPLADWVGPAPPPMFGAEFTSRALMGFLSAAGLPDELARPPVLPGDLSKSEELKDFSKALPEGVGWAAEKYLEYKTLVLLFKGLGLSRVLGAFGTKLSQKVVGKEIMVMGGKAALAAQGGWNAFRVKVLQGFLRTLPENAAFLSAWRASSAVLQYPKRQIVLQAEMERAEKVLDDFYTKLDKHKIGSPERVDMLKQLNESELLSYYNQLKKDFEAGFVEVVGKEGIAGAKWGIGFSLAMPLIIETGSAILSAPATERLIMKLQVKYPKIVDFLAGQPEEELVALTFEQIKRMGREHLRAKGEPAGPAIKFTDLPRDTQNVIKFYARKLRKIIQKGEEMRAAQEAYWAAPGPKEGKIAKVPGAPKAPKVPAVPSALAPVAEPAVEPTKVPPKAPEAKVPTETKFEAAAPEQPEATVSLTDTQTGDMLSGEVSAFEKAKEVAKTSFGLIRDTAHRVHDWIFAFGEAKRTMPELYDKLMSSFGKRNAGIEKSITEVEKVIGPEGISLEDGAKLARIFEDKRLSPPEELKDAYDRFSTLFAEIEKTSRAEGIFEKPFQERMLEEINGQIETELLKLRSTGKGDSKRLKELLAEEETIKNMRYLPHNVVAQKAIEAKLSTLSGKPRKTFLENLSRLSSKFKKREGRLFLKDYIESGLLEPKDIDIRKLAAEALSDYYYRSSIKSLYDFANEQGLIKPASDELRKEGWMTAKEAGITAPELKNKMLHPLFGSSLNELKAMRHRKGGLVRRTLGMIKIGQFVKPWIIWIYNTVQKYMRGMYSFNPVSEAEAATEAIKAVMNETELYHKLNESNLFQFPYEVSRASRDEQINMMLRRTITDKDSWDKAIIALEKVTGTSWATQDVDIRKALMIFYQSIARATWTGDKIQRTQSYLMCRRMGYPHDEAVKVASNAHGAYSILSKKYKETLSPILFVYSFRILMPMEMMKIALEPIIGIAEAAYKRQGIPKHKAKRWAKAVIATIAIPVLVDQYMKARGFEKEGAHLGPLAWKYKKTILDPDTGRESDIVVGMNYILNMPVKYWQRITYYNPIRPEARWQQSLEHLIKWEVHPLWRIFFWDIADNRKSFGSGVQVYNTEDPPMIQAGQIAKYVFGQSLRFWGGMMDAVGEGSMTDKERADQEDIFEEGLTKLDRVLFTVLGYKYTRSNLDERKAIMGKFLLKETKSRAFNIARKYEGEEKDKRVADLEKWARRCEKWIKEEMK